MKQKIMAVGAHADDIELQVGGTLLKYHAADYEIVYVMSTNNMAGSASVRLRDGSMGKIMEPPLKMMKRRKGECKDAAKMLGTVPIHLDHPQRHYWDGGKTVRLSYGSPLPEGVPADVPPIITAYEDEKSVTRLAELILEKNPECILTHPVAQVDVEHFSTCRLVTNAYWKAVESGFKGALLYWREYHMIFGDFNCRWETFIDYTPYLEEKMKLVGMHRCQMPNAHLPDFAHRELARRWGAACGCGAAEVFCWCRRAERTDMDDPVYRPLTLDLLKNSR